MSAILVDGATVSVIATAPAISVLVVSVSASLDKINLGTKGAIIFGDIEKAIKGGNYAYVTAAHTIVGALSVSSVSSSNNTSKMAMGANDVMLRTVSGNVNYTVKTPANIPGTPPVPDTVTAYAGTWSVVLTGQGIDKIFSN